MPEFLGRFHGRVPIAIYREQGHGLVAGLLLHHNGAWRLRDSSDELILAPSLVERLALQAPAWLALELGPHDRAIVHHRQRIEGDAALEHDWARSRDLRRRWQIHSEIRNFFRERHFIEVDTPVAVPNPGSEPYLDTFAVEDLFLRTSPELHMKRLLGQGFDSLFQMGPCFRRGDRGHWHREEFIMLEWYRCFADLEHIAEDLSQLLLRLAPLSSDPVYFAQAPERVTCHELFTRHLGLDLRDHEDSSPLREALTQRGLSHAPEDDWDTLYFLLFLNFIEGQLGQDRPVFVSHYPASQAALAKRAPLEPGKLPTCYRMEVYLRGTELANAFYELTDGAEQRARFAADSKRRQSLGKTTYPDDRAFLATLDHGLPPCAGIALGVDRLVSCLLGASTLDSILPFAPGT